MDNGDIMKLKINNKTNYISGDTDIEYIYDDINSNDDIIKLTDKIENKYGNIEEIICVKKDKEDNITFFKEYYDVLEFKNNFDINNLGVITFNLRDKYITFILNSNTKTFTVYDRQNALGDKLYNPNKVKYYQDEYDNIVKYDGNTGIFYMLDIKLNRFIPRNDISSKFYGDGGYKEISYIEENILNEIHR